MPGPRRYLRRGYVPDGRCQYAASSGLDYAYDDWCVAQAARKLGKMHDYRVLMDRAKNIANRGTPASDLCGPGNPMASGSTI